jgi:hypothetical protein
MSITRRWIPILLGVMLAALSGCRSRGGRGVLDYHVQVRNETSGIVRAVVVRDVPDRILPVIESQIYPRDRAELSLPMRARQERLILQVDAPNNPGSPAKMPLAPGQSIITVMRQGDEGPINLELLQGK